MKKLLPLLTATLLALGSFAQDQHLVDSLETLLKNHNAKRLELGKNAPVMYDTTAVAILYALSKAHWGNNPVKATGYAERSLQVSEQINYKKGMGNAYNSLGVINKQSGNYLRAMEFHKKALKIEEEINDKNGIAFSYLNIGNIYFEKGIHAEALKNYFSSLRISEEIGDHQNTGFSYSNIGNIYDAQNNYPDALKNYKAALKIFESIGDKKYIAAMNINLAGIYVEQGNYSEAINTNYKALKVAEEIGFKYGVANAYSTIGNIYNKQGNYAEGLKNLFNALNIFEETADILNKAQIYISIGNTYSWQKNYNMAGRFLNKALVISMEIGSVEGIESSYGGLAKLDSLNGNLRQELTHYKQYIVYRDSLVNNENTNKITQQQMQFDFDKKQVADSLEYAQEKEIGAIKLQKQKTIAYGGFGGIAITIILLFFVYNNYRKQRLANKQLKEAQEQLIKSEKMAAFGVMASRVSHEIQNPLNFVNNFSELSKEMLTDVISSTNEEDKRQNTALLFNNLQKINEQGKRASEIVKQLQEHTRKGSAHEYFEEKTVKS